MFLEINISNNSSIITEGKKVMKRIRRLICTLLSISMILTATAIYAFGQTIDSVNQGNVSDSSSKELKLQVMDTGNRFPGVENSSSFPKLKMNRKGAKIGRGEKAETESLLLSAHPERHELSLGIYQPKSG